MSHEPGRERHMIHKCEKCCCIVPAGELYHFRKYDEYWCENCIDNYEHTGETSKMANIRCDKCDASMPDSSIEDDYGEFICASCTSNANEAAYDRQQEANLESPPESAREEQLRTWKEHKKAQAMKYENLGWIEQLQGYASRFTISGQSFINVFLTTKLTEEACPIPAERLNSDAVYVESVLGHHIEEFIDANNL